MGLGVFSVARPARTGDNVVARAGLDRLAADAIFRVVPVDLDEGRQPDGRTATADRARSARLRVSLGAPRAGNPRPAGRRHHPRSGRLQPPQHLADDAAAVLHRPVAGEAALSVKNRLKVLRAERNWSQQDLANELGVSRQTINAIETEKYDPSLPLAMKVGRLFALPVETIFTLDEQSVKRP
jgi:putative transcriptional regulator